LKKYEFFPSGANFYLLHDAFFEMSPSQLFFLGLDKKNISVKLKNATHSKLNDGFNY